MHSYLGIRSWHYADNRVCSVPPMWLAQRTAAHVLLSTQLLDNCSGTMRLCTSGESRLLGPSHRCRVLYGNCMHIGAHGFQNRHQLWVGLWMGNSHKPWAVESQICGFQPGVLVWGTRLSLLSTFAPRDADDLLCRVASYERNLQVGNGRNVCEGGELTEAVAVLDVLVQRGHQVDTSLFSTALRRCVAQKDLVLGRRVHALALQGGFESNSFLANQIINMYAFHGRLEEAAKVFDKVAAPNAHVWASIILAHARQGQPTQAIKLYRLMKESAVKPDNHIFVAALKSCAAAADLPSGKEVHADVLKSTGKPNIFVGNGLLDMYAKCGSLVDARRVFDSLPIKNVVTWSAMIAGYAQNGLGQESLVLFASMQEEGIVPNKVTFSSLLQACASTRALDEGKRLHSWIREQGLEGDVVVGNCLVDMYAKCGNLEDARRVFEQMPKRTVVTWTAMIAGYVQHGLGQEALALYANMQQEDLTPANHMTFSCLLQACASVGALQLGKQVHEQIHERGSLERDLVLGNCLVDMYAKCGQIRDAQRVFDQLPTKDVVTWTALLNGYAQQGDAQMAVRCFAEMQQHGVKPDGTTFISLLVACSHDGLVDEGRRFFRMMVEEHGIVPTAYHLTCMVDLLARSGCLGEAEDMLLNLPCEENVVGWTSLLSACKSHGDIERGRRCFDHLVDLDPEDATAYVLLGNIYANAGKWSDVCTVENWRKFAGARKKAAKAYIEVGNKVHEFTVGEDRSDVSSKLRSMNWKLQEEGGHVPDNQLVLKYVPERGKEDALCGHAEKLALAYGLLNTPDGMTLLVTKNLRMCNDCHNSTKIMSRLEKREIIVRDAHRVHLFLDGSCSCGDRH